MGSWSDMLVMYQQQAEQGHSLWYMNQVIILSRNMKASMDEHEPILPRPTKVST